MEFSINSEFQQDVLQVADALNVDELQAAAYYLEAQQESASFGLPVLNTIVRFHEQRAFLLECLRLIFAESFEVEKEGSRALMQDCVAQILDIQSAPLRNGSLFARKCVNSMVDIENWLVLLGEQVQKASIVGSQDPDILEIIEYQRDSLCRQHESLGAILSYVFKGTFTSPEDFRFLLDKLRKINRVDACLIHYIPVIVSSVAQYGSSEGTGTNRDAQSLHDAIISSKDSQSWALPKFHAATMLLWVAGFSSWFSDATIGSPDQGRNTDSIVDDLNKLFTTALEDGALEFILAICSHASDEEHRDTARNELVSLLLKDDTVFESCALSDYFYPLLMEHIQEFTESIIANMPDAIRKLKSEEDLQRLDQITALREGLSSTLHRNLTDARMHFETLLVVMAFAFEHRTEAAQEFWADTDGNLYGFLQWASRRQTVPRASAFCELLCSISEGEENSMSAHKFLLDEDNASSKFRRSSSMNWNQMMSELQLYATKTTEKPSTSTTSFLRVRKPESADIHEPESPVMLTCYLRLISHICYQNSVVREWILRHSSFNMVRTLLTLCGAPVPSHLRTGIFNTLRSLIIDGNPADSDDMWNALDHWVSGLDVQRATPIISLVPGSPNWEENHVFHTIMEAFDQTNAFVELLETLVSVPPGLSVSQLYLTFPESLGSSYRMPGIEPYVDFVMGQAFAGRSVNLPDSEARVLQLKCLRFAATCLETFNENMIIVANQPATPLASNPLSALTTYTRLHPFARVMEWLFNEDVLKVLFAAAHQDASDVEKSFTDSILLRCLSSAINIMNLVLNLQPTYFDIVRPFVKSQAKLTASSVANLSLTSLEDSVVDNLQIISDLCLYCGAGHPQLTIISLSLLEKLSGSRKFNRIPSNVSRWQPFNQIVEALDNNIDVGRVSQALASQMTPELREIENGPESSGYLIKLGVTSLLNRCLDMLPDKPNLSHLLLGFACLGLTLDINDNEIQLSLLHAVIDIVKIYPLGVDSSTVVSWMVRLKRISFSILKRLWTSSLSSALALPELRASQLLVYLFISQPPVNANTFWDDFRPGEPAFWLSDSAVALAEFLGFRSILFDYVATELRFNSKQRLPSSEKAILSTVFGLSTGSNNESISHPSFFDLFDFADLDVDIAIPRPETKFFEDIDLDLCASIQENNGVVLHDFAAAQELLELEKENLLERVGQLTAQDEEQLAFDMENILLFLRATDQNRLVHLNRYLAIRSWAELATTIIVTCHMDLGRKAMFVLQVLQVILPKLEMAVNANAPEAIELARLAESLIETLDSGSASEGHSRSDIIDERLHYMFQACLRGIPSVLENTVLRECLFDICSRYLSRIIYGGKRHERFRSYAHQTMQNAGPNMVELISDDAYSGPDSCRISALVLLNMLTILDRQHSSILVLESIVRSNHLSMFIDNIRAMPLEFNRAQSTDIPLLLTYYKTHLSLLQELCQTKVGAEQVLEAGIFLAVKESQLFAIDPDIGIDIDDPDALHKYHSLLLSVLRVIVCAVFSRGFHNQQVIEQTRVFLSEHRASMVGIFKRFGRATSVGEKMDSVLEELMKSFVALVTAVDFLEVCICSRH